ncbi:ERI1 exoribonuclease 3 [Odontomachus brunneus]|uniref:ERI1 exoribonuclease 3 n=1 Tax=Odontomachus brunneus TaxID=486640 RepID=UPI0013F25621|nr:ERI1 exoribonuclease 3 [Odontomachus brunneus]XP_032682557.1 ERI1 exoribonuclease 3 [Odontomachus brunneus]XP_032682558.1 ERI1 exoribonuclease 3 [Odontomachus brunneus]XP_032682559.1 ERI1 exoribonuclease 3 [Odontomachus brunneus]XP_032682560.1 ERI1 exoribonuclease 3 [Odontomachus brunneus]XP_032682561.1 ERI1 exoribonuclease 3 [Odontomachus brunneus]
MTHRILRGIPRIMTNHYQEIMQNFEYLLVMDFEATCKKYQKLQPQEIIELPCAVLSTRDWDLKDTFHEYVKPRVHPILTPFCTELTGIMQDMVDDQSYFPDVFSRFCNWLKKGGYFDESDKSTFVTCGNWDLKVMLPSQCSLDGITLPDQFKQWIDLKHTFSEYKMRYPRGLQDMLARLNLPLQGHLHSGIDDVKNMVTIIRALHEKHNVQFKITSSLTTSTLNLKDYKRNTAEESVVKKDRR